MAAKKPAERFEMSKLMELQEPLTVYLERLESSTTEPITLPALGHDRNIDGQGTPGTGWKRDDVTKLAAWVRDFYSGAGTYMCQVVDQRSKALEWEFSIPQSDTVKRRPPPPLGVGNFPPPSAVSTVAPMAAPPPTAMAPVGQQLSGPPANVQGWGNSQQVPVTQWTPQAQQQQAPQAWTPQAWSPPNQPPPQFQPGMAPNNPYGPPPGYPGYHPAYPGGPPWGAPPWAPPAPPGGVDNAELRKIREELDASKRREIELKAQQENDKIRADHARELDTLRNEIRSGKDSTSSKEADEARRLREERDRDERERDRRENDARFSALAESMKGLAAAITQKPAGEPDTVREMREENRRRDEENKREREREKEEHRREMDRRDREAKDLEMRREQKELAERTERLIREAQNSRPDPVLEMMKENTRVQAESSRQLAAMTQTQMQIMQQQSINPMQLMTILDKKESSGDSFMRSIMPAMTGVIELYKGAAEQVVGLAGGGPGATWQPVAEHVVSSGKEILERYFGAKRDIGVSENKAKIAQSEAVAHSAQAQAHIATMQAQAAQAQGRPAAPSQPMNGAAVPQNGQSAPAQAAPSPQAAQTQAAPQEGGQVIQMPRKQSIQQETFGVAFESVMRMRRSIKEGKLNPKQAIDGMMQGVTAFLDNQDKHPVGDPERWLIPAFTLYQEERWADLVDVVLDGCPQPFKDECVRILVEDMEPEDGDDAAPPDPATTV